MRESGATPRWGSGALARVVRRLLGLPCSWAAHSHRMASPSQAARNKIPSETVKMVAAQKTAITILQLKIFLNPGLPKILLGRPSLCLHA